MEVRKTITAELSRKDIEVAIIEWMQKQGWTVIDIEFHASDVDTGATCNVKQNDPS